MYDTLDRSSREVRLIRLVDEDPPPGAQWAFEMQRSPLGDEAMGAASALSYVWGKYNDNAVQVSINGHFLRITANLHSAISSFAKHDELRQSWWWIDAICINQEDIDERGFQVGLMKELYARVGRTVAFLGLDADGTISKVLSWLQRLEHERQTRPSKLEWITEAAKDPELSDSWKALDSVFRKEWWVRAWILQESVVSPTLLFLGGDSLVPEPAIFGALLYIRVCQKSIRDHLVRLGMGMDGWSHTFRDIYDRLQLRPQYEKDKEISFISLLALRLNFFATDPRDYVYGLFALSGSMMELMPAPNYAAPVWEIYASWLRSWFGSRNDLNLLTLGGWPRGNSDIPSWVPDISCRNGPGLPLISSDCMLQMNLTYKEHYSKKFKDATTDRSVALPEFRTAAYRAKGWMTAQYDFPYDDPRSLQCWGVCVDTVDGIAGTKGLVRNMPDDANAIHHQSGPRIPNKQPKGSLSAYGSAEKTKDAIWRCLIMDRIPTHLSEPAPALGGVLLAKECMEVENGKGDPGWGSLWEIIRDFEVNGQTLLSWFQGDLSDLRVRAWEALTDYYRGLDGARAFRRPQNPVIDRSKHILCEMQRHLCVTEKGYVGMVTTNAEPGDEVWVLLGCNIPVVLRKREDGKRTLIGECYLHGIMYGEAVTAIEAGREEGTSCIIT